MTKTKDRLAEIVDHKRQSFDWMSTNFYPEWEDVYKSYICKRDPELIPGTLEPDLSRSSIESPNTFATIWRTVARLTAQAPNLRFRSRTRTFDPLISTTVMWNWDAGGIQSVQKRHLRQAAIFGLSIRPWWWEKRLAKRRKRVDIRDMKMPEAALAAIADTFGPTIGEWMAQNQAVLAAWERMYQMQPDPLKLLQDEQVGPILRMHLLARHGRGGYLPIEYTYCAYDGPMADFLFIGDCYPQPRFQKLQSSKWFIVEKRYDRAQMENLVTANPDNPEIAAVVEKILRDNPDGSPYRPYGDQYSSHLRERLFAVSGIADSASLRSVTDSGYWSITEEHTPGVDGTIAYTFDNTAFIGEVPYPYDLDGRIAFSECRMMDNLLHGIGDTPVRILNPQQKIFSRVLSRQVDAMDYILRPMIGTYDQHIFENPDNIKPMNGYRLVLLRGGQNSAWVLDSSPVANSARSSFEFTGEMHRNWQLGSGESNLSMMAAVDPSQSRTATGAKMLQANLDVLTKDQMDMTNLSLRDDGNLLYWLNRSEMSDVQYIDQEKYNRDYRSALNETREAWVAVEPMMFQEDGHIEPELGSTLADDDEWKAQQASMLFQMFNGNPLVNQETLRDEVLIAFNKGRDLKKWAAQPQPPPQPEQRKPTASLSVSARLDQLPAEAAVSLLKQAEIIPPDAPAVMEFTPPEIPLDPNHVMRNQTRIDENEKKMTLKMVNDEADREFEEDQAHQDRVLAAFQTAAGSDRQAEGQEEEETS